jgi:hypothetical protein
VKGPDGSGAGDQRERFDWKVSAKELRALKTERDAFYGDWNYAISPREQTS